MGVEGQVEVEGEEAAGRGAMRGGVVAAGEEGVKAEVEDKVVDGAMGATTVAGIHLTHRLDSSNIRMVAHSSLPSFPSSTGRRTRLISLSLSAAMRNSFHNNHTSLRSSLSNPLRNRCTSSHLNTSTRHNHNNTTRKGLPRSSHISLRPASSPRTLITHRNSNRPTHLLASRSTHASRRNIVILACTTTTNTRSRQPDTMV